MAFTESYQKFAKFVKVTDAAKYEEVKASQNYAGSIIFYADNTHAGFYQKIYANGIEYNVIDSSYIQRWSDVLDASDNFDLSKINDSAVIDTSIIKKLITDAVDAAAITLEAGETTYTRDDNDNTITTTLNVSYNDGDSSIELPFTIHSDTLDLSTATGGITIDVSYTDSSVDIANAAEAESSIGVFASRYAIKEYVDYALGQFNGALVYKGSISPSTNTSTADIAYLTGAGLSGADVSGDFANYYATEDQSMESPADHDDNYKIIPSVETPEIGYTFVANSAGYINFANKVVVSGELHTFEEIDPENYDPTQYEGYGTFTDTNVVYLEPGDMVIVTDVSTDTAYDETAGENVEFKKITAITVVNRNVTSANGLVTATSTFTNDHIVLGDSGYGIKDSSYEIYAPEDASFVPSQNAGVGDGPFYASSNSSRQNVIPSVLAVKAYVDESIATIPQASYTTEFDDTSLVASVITPQTSDGVDVSTHVIDIAAAVNSSYYVNISVDDTNFDSSTIVVGVKTLSMSQYAANVSNNTEPLDGLATTADVYSQITLVEKVVAGAIAQTGATVGLTSDFGVDWHVDPTDPNTSLLFNPSTNVVDAIKILKAEIQSKGDLSADEFDTSVRVDGAANTSILDVSFSTKANGDVLLNVSLNTAETAATLAANSAYANTSATALMSDKDVNVAIENALCWAIIS